MSISSNALLRIREEMHNKDINQRDMAERLKCSQGRVNKMLNGGVNLRVEDLGALARAVGLPITETLRDRGLEFYAEVTPREQRILERLRQRGSHVEQAVLQLLDVEEKPLRRKVGRPMNSVLARKDQRKDAR